MISFIYKTVLDFQLSEDVAQDCFVELWIHSQRFARKSSLKTYLYSMGRKKAINALRKKSRSDFSNSMDSILTDGDPVLESILLTERDTKIWTAMRSLPTEQMEIVYLRYFEQMNYKDIERVLGITTKKLYKLSKQIKSSLRDLLGESTEEL